MPDPLDVAARALNDHCPHPDRLTCGCQPGAIARHDARKVLDLLAAAGIGLVGPPPALEMRTEVAP